MQSGTLMGRHLTSPTVLPLMFRTFRQKHSSLVILPRMDFLRDPPTCGKEPPVSIGTMISIVQLVHGARDDLQHMCGVQASKL